LWWPSQAPLPANPAFERCVWENDRKLFGAVKDGVAPMEVLSVCVPTESDDRNPLLRQTIELMTEGYPIQAMVPAIILFDREIAALIVGIAKKESDWGKHTPKQGGKECFNYWGYRAPGSLGLTPDGYGCFATPEEGATVIGERLEKLAGLRVSTEPRQMVVWKCGSSCAGHSDESVRKWISDVEHYYRKIVALS
jgi:hypothetical protein